MTPARLFIESEKLAQADDEFAKQLKVRAKAWEVTTHIHSKCKTVAFLISCHTHVILSNCRFCVQTFFIA